jgi:hypothetical protein
MTVYIHKKARRGTVASKIFPKQIWDQFVKEAEGAYVQSISSGSNGLMKELFQVPSDNDWLQLVLAGHLSH